MNDPLFVESPSFGPSDHTALARVYEPRPGPMLLRDKVFLGGLFMVVLAILAAGAAQI